MTQKTPSQKEEVREIRSNGTLLAIVYKNIVADGVRFLTDTSFPLQIGVLEHRQGKLVPAHKHTPVSSSVDFAQEWLYVERGSIHVTVTDAAWNAVDSVTLAKGDSILFVSGAHEVTFEKNTRVIEVKQGPYPGDKDAKIHK